MRDMVNSIKNRIIGYAEVDPNSLLANENNWRTHPMYQRQVVGSSLEQIGWVQSVIINVRKNSPGWQADERIPTMLDGHLRVLLALETDEESIPAEYVDLGPEEEKMALLLLDPSSALAAADKEKLQELAKSVKPMDETQVAFLSGLMEQYKVGIKEGGNGGGNNVQEQVNYIPFSFGEYKGLVEKETYKLFTEQIERIKIDTGYTSMADLMAVWMKMAVLMGKMTDTEQDE